MFRDLIPALADDYHVVAPDVPGFGFSDAPDRAQFRYTFDHLADVIDGFTTVAGLTRYAVYVFDYGAPVGFHLATSHPERITAITTQNGNAYKEGLSEGWNPIQRYWKEAGGAGRSGVKSQAARARRSRSRCRCATSTELDRILVDGGLPARFRRRSAASRACSLRSSPPGGP
jgi:pimeloyl-ACP methyl ester carboxylesterase